MTSTLHNPLVRLGTASSIDDVIANLDQIVEWSIEAENPIGYFAVLYQRGTVAIRNAIRQPHSEFDDPERMERFDVLFAQRYFDALNAYFHPEPTIELSVPWEIAFLGADDAKATMLQQMMAGLNAHINFDLGVAAVAIAGNELGPLEPDFKRITALVAAQTDGMLNVVQQRSPEVVWIRRAIPRADTFITDILNRFRTAAWNFAIYLAMHPDDVRAKTASHSSWTAALGSWYLEPSGKWTPIPHLVRAIARRENRDIGGNIRALAGITHSPEMRYEAYL